jgi:hypothetical protein
VRDVLDFISIKWGREGDDLCELIVIMFGSLMEKSILFVEWAGWFFLLVLPPQFPALGLLAIHSATGLRFSWILFRRSLFLACAQIWIFQLPFLLPASFCLDSFSVRTGSGQLPSFSASDSRPRSHGKAPCCYSLASCLCDHRSVLIQ